MPVKRKQQLSEKSSKAVVEAPTQDFTTFESDSEEAEEAVGVSDSEKEKEDEDDDDDDDDEVEMSAETRAELLKGFDSDTSDEDDEEDAQGAEDDRIIELSNLTPSISSALAAKGKNTKKKNQEETGVLYIGRIPHGFYEEEMTSYFTQFGNILNLRLSRSKKTGRSRHYAFIEFADRGVAEIVAQTMHNYLLASHLLQVVLLTPEEVLKKGGSDLFKGAGHTFKAVPWSRIAKERVEAPKTKEQWQALEKREQKRRVQQAGKVKAAGIDYEYESPAQKKQKTATSTTTSSSGPKSKKEASTTGPGSRKSSAAGARKASGAPRKVSVK